MAMLRALMIIALVSFTSGNLFGQAGTTDSLLAIIEKDKRDYEHVRALALLSQQYRGKDNAKTIFYFKEVLRLGHIDYAFTAKSFAALGLIYSDLSMNDSAHYFFEQARKIIDAHPNDKVLLTSFYNGLGLLYKKQGDSEKALENFLLLEKLGEEAAGKENFAGNYLNIANTYGRMGRRLEAIEFTYKALRLFESVKNKKGMSYCYNSLGSLLKQQGHLDESLIYLLKSLEMKKQDNDLKGIANTSNELALVYVDLKNPAKALPYVEETISISDKLGIQELLATGLVHKAKILRIQGKNNEALAVLEKARPVAQSLESHFVLAQLQAEAGKIYSEKAKSEEAVMVLLSSIDEASRSKNVEALISAHQFLGEEYARSGKYKEALEHFDKYHQLDDSLRGNQLKLDYKRLETQYEVEKKNAEIELLKKDQEIQAQTAKRQRAFQSVIGIGLLSVVIISGLLINRYRVINRSKRLLEIERVRNTIARDLHDDIGSTLSSINIVSRLGQQNHENGNPAEHFRKIADHSSALMDRMSDIVWSINPANDSMSMMVAKMKEFSAEILEPKNIQYSFFGAETLNGEVLDIEKRRNIFLVFKEAVNNAAKYSGGSRVDIEIRMQDKNLFLKIRDNGKGFDMQHGRKGNGLRNMKERADAIRASLVVNSSVGKGTDVALSIPIT